MPHIEIADVVAALERAYPPSLAEPWDAVGLVCGELDALARRVLFVVDPAPEVIDEALEWEADLIVAHHPLLLRGVHGVPAATPKGSVVHRLIRAGVALFTAHTNADRARPGVSDALAEAVGLSGELHPIDPVDREPWCGLGRIGRLPVATTLRAFADTVATVLPATAGGVRACGDPGKAIRTVAVSGGAGDSLLDAVAAAGVDAYLTADLRHHPATEFDAAANVALLDAAHWATEWPWLPRAARMLEEAFDSAETTLETRVSRLVTDAWTYRAHPGIESCS